MVLLLIAAGLITYHHFQSPDPVRMERESSVSRSTAPADAPVIYWNDDDPQPCFDELTDCLSALKKDVVIVRHKNLEWEEICRDLFWVENFSISSIIGSDEKTYHFTYKKDAADNKKMQKEIDAEVQDILSLIPSGIDDWNKVLLIHDELVRRVAYSEDTETLHCHDIYGALAEHDAVCQGYTYAMSYIAKKLGVETGEAYSDTHVWNYFPGFDTSECYMDVTWDDLSVFDENGSPYIVHDHFGLTKSEMEALSEHEPSNKLKSYPSGSVTGDNYFRRKGWLIPSGDLAHLELAVKEQLESGGNLIELRFEDAADFAEAADRVNQLLRDMNYNERYLLWDNKDLMIFDVGLYPAES